MPLFTCFAALPCAHTAAGISKSLNLNGLGKDICGCTASTKNSRGLFGCPNGRQMGLIQAGKFIFTARIVIKQAGNAPCIHGVYRVLVLRRHFHLCCCKIYHLLHFMGMPHKGQGNNHYRCLLLMGPDGAEISTPIPMLKLFAEVLVRPDASLGNLMRDVHYWEYYWVIDMHVHVTCCTKQRGPFCC